MVFVKLPEPPGDGTTALRFAPDGSSLLASSWDSILRLYGAAPSSCALRATLPQPSPLLDCDFVDARTVASGGLDGAVRLSPLDGAGGERVLGEHAGAARCVRRCDAVGALVTAGWDATLKLWDVRAADACVGTYAQPGKVHALCVGAGAAAPPRVVVAAAGRRVDVLDLRMPDEPPLRFESGLRTQARCVAQMASGDGFVLGAVDGRVAIEYFDPSEASQSRKFAFKAHHEAGAGGKPAVAHPVNAVAFHPVHGTFATGGCDGRVNVWDGAAKKRVFQYEKLATSVAALAFSPNGDTLAIAASYTYEHGERSHPPDALHLHAVADAEVRPKPRAK